ncbi:MAG: proton-conducting transporter membrane subunit [Acidobacteriota bacterium]
MIPYPGAWLLASLGCLLAGALLSLLCGSRSGRAAGVAFASVLLAALLALPPAASALAAGNPWEASLPWSMPWGTMRAGLDGLSAFFLLFALVLAVPAAAYGKGYLAHHRESQWDSASWAFFQVLVAAMALVVLARDGVLFLLAWEGMSVSSFFLVIHDHEDAAVRQDGLVYLTATHLGAACLAAMFGLWGVHAGTLSFDGLAATALAPPAAWAVFLLGLAGFGSKAGLVPFHVWLPKAHPAAPSHVSALMSGVMIKMGVYGLVRLLLLAGHPPRAWGYVLLAMGAASALGGVAYALAQHDLKRLLAYHSVENVGIIVLGLGAALLAKTSGLEGAALLAAAGALLHTLNHGLFKGLLFYSGGAAAQAAGTRDVEELGGLLKRMPYTGAAFLAGSAAICALPPFNGFVSEWLVYAGLLTGALRGADTPSVVLFAAVPSLALVGGLALACFAKASGVVFLGEPRSLEAARAQERGLWMRAPMAAVGAACLAVGLGAPWAWVPRGPCGWSCPPPRLWRKVPAPRRMT